MRKKNILVTGPTGYIGRYVVKELNKFPDKFSVTLLTRAQYCDPAFHGEVLYHDILKDNKRLMEEPLLEDIDVCVHMAWSDGFVHNAPSHMLNVSEHFNFLKTLIDKGVKRLVVLGSFREYGSVDGLVSESNVIVPNNLYTLAKLTLKRSLEIYLEGKDVDLFWLRPFTVYGDDEKTNSLFAKILKWDKQGKESFPFTDGKEQYDYINVQFLAKMIVASVETEVKGGVVDCCSGVPTELGVMVSKLIAAKNLKIRPEYNAFPKRTYDSPIIFGNTKKIKEILAISSLYKTDPEISNFLLKSNNKKHF